MEVYRRSSWLLLILGISFLATTLQGVQGEVESEGPSESECRPYIEKALKSFETGEAVPPGHSGDGDSKEDIPTVEITTDDSDQPVGEDEDDQDGNAKAESAEIEAETPDAHDSVEEDQDQSNEQDNETDDDDSHEQVASKEHEDTSGEQQADEPAEEEPKQDTPEVEEGEKSAEDNAESGETKEESHEAEGEVEAEASVEQGDDTTEEHKDSAEKAEKSEESEETAAASAETQEDSKEDEPAEGEAAESTEDATKEDDDKSKENDTVSAEDQKAESHEEGDAEGHSEEEKEGDEAKQSEEAEEHDEAQSKEEGAAEAGSVEDDDTKEEADTKEDDETKEDEDEHKKSAEESAEHVEQEAEASKEEGSKEEAPEAETEPETEQAEEEEVDAKEESKREAVPEEGTSEEQADQPAVDELAATEEGSDEEAEEKAETEPSPEEELTQEFDIPTNLRNTDHLYQLLKLDEESAEKEGIINRIADITLRDLKKLYENAIHPLETLYKYRDLSNRHFGDAEIFSKPLVLFMGPWSGGKSSIINYLLDNEYNETSLRTGAEPSPAYFNILMHGEEPEVLDGTQLAADFTFSGLQKFGQGLEERLRGLKLPNKLLEKINLVEIPGILEVRKQVSRLFPFNDACQWFIDRADIIFLVYDPSKLDVGPETEAILDQLKGREYQTRIVLNKADQVKPEELMRVQGALIWNISPLMSSPQPPVMYTTSLWSRPYEQWAPVRLLQAQERAFLRDLRTAIDKRIDNKISSARRFAVRVRNHAKMVDCYLTTYYNHKSVFGNKKLVSDQIIEHPQDYHIYEGLSTLTNISRYDLPDPEVYKGFFKLNPLYDFQQLSATCTYFRGCPINRLDVAIAYDLPELVGKHKRLVEAALAEANQSQTPGS